MEVVQILCMNGGMGNTSYANNSSLKEKVITMTKPITEEAIISLCNSKLFPLKTIAIAELGCSSGPNTLLAIFQLIKMVNNICQKHGHESPEYQVFLNDLPSNDFNTLFKLLPNFNEKMENQMGIAGFGPCFFTAVPGSFYGRLFPSNSLHFVHSSYSLQWLSQVPDGVENENKQNIYIASSSPPSVLKAYYEQFRKDFSLFLKCRSEELAAGGRMVLTMLGRKSDDPSSKECCYIWELMAMALNQMVSEGIIEEEKMETFNIPQYTPSPNEVKIEVENEGSFVISRLEVSEVNWNANDNEIMSFDMNEESGYSVAQCMRAVAEPLLISHFGEEIIDQVFLRYTKILTDCMAKEKTMFFNVIVALTKA